MKKKLQEAREAVVSQRDYCANDYRVGWKICSIIQENCYYGDRIAVNQDVEWVCYEITPEVALNEVTYSPI